MTVRISNHRPAKSYRSAQFLRDIGWSIAEDDFFMKGNKDDTLFPRERNVVMVFQSHAR
jgi:hypothetical protein